MVDKIPTIIFINKKGTAYPNMRMAVLALLQVMGRAPTDSDKNYFYTICRSNKFKEYTVYTLENAKHMGANCTRAPLRFLLKEAGMLSEANLSTFEYELEKIMSPIIMKGASESMMNDKNANPKIDELLVKAKKNCDRLYKNSGEAKLQLAKINIGIKKFDDSLQKMAMAARKLAASKIDKERFQAIVREQMENIKAPCHILNIKLGQIVSKTDSVTKADIMAFKKYASGLRKIYRDKIKQLDGNKGTAATESVEYMEASLMEGNFSNFEDHYDVDEDTPMESDDKLEDEEISKFEEFANSCESMMIDSSSINDNLMALLESLGV